MQGYGLTCLVCELAYGGQYIGIFQKNQSCIKNTARGGDKHSPFKIENHTGIDDHHQI